jgi:hypothetical protein
LSKVTVKSAGCAMFGQNNGQENGDREEKAPPLGSGQSKLLLDVNFRVGTSEEHTLLWTKPCDELSVGRGNGARSLACFVLSRTDTWTVVNRAPRPASGGNILRRGITTGDGAAEGVISPGHAQSICLHIPHMICAR